MTYHLNCYQDWLTYYENKAAEVPYHVRADPLSFQSAMVGVGRTALDSRARQLRDSDSYQNKKLKTGFAGLIPFLKIPVSVADAEEFADESLQAFGLSDTPGLR